MKVPIHPNPAEADVFREELAIQTSPNHSPVSGRDQDAPSMVEKVARAYYEAWRARMHELGCATDALHPWSDVKDQWREAEKHGARAAIEAMREPLPAMAIAGDAAYRAASGPGSPYYCGLDGFVPAFRAAIDEALK